MKQLTLFGLSYLITGFMPILLLSCNNKGDGFINPGEKTLAGYVISRETCHNNPDLDSWLIDFSFMNNQELVGDTLTIQGITYTNVVKVKGLTSKFQQQGFPVRVYYKQITDGPVVPTDCDRPDAEVYNLKELIIIHQSEQR